LRKFLAEFRKGAVTDWPVLAGAFTSWLGLLAALASVGVSGIGLTAYRDNLVLYASALLFILAYAIGRLLWVDRPARPISFLFYAASTKGLMERLIRGAPLLLALILFLPAFSAMKSALPLFNVYTWDETWIQLDRTLHGTDPWRILNGAFGNPVVTSVISGLYQIWILLIYLGGVYFCFFQDNRTLRARYFITYFACWIVLGTVSALAFASVGPCFLEPLLGDPHFAEQMTSLREINEHAPVFSLLVQDRLIDWHASGSEGLGRGISAMPSMHVSLAFLFFLAMRGVSKMAGLVFGLFAGIILIGSVHLAYHYAVDGYVSIAATWLIWAIAGPLARHVADRQGGADDSTDILPVRHAEPASIGWPRNSSAWR
jgi:hypothetical protein